VSKESWKNQAFEDQMSAARDFPHETAIKTRYAICCGHRTGSNLLSEALYKTGVAGDPMEYFNLRFLSAFTQARGKEQLDMAVSLREMRKRRTSTNGVFGINVKIDQLNSLYKNNWPACAPLVKDNDLVVYLYRRDKIRQAISVYIGQSRDTFNAPADVSDEQVRELIADIPYDPALISQCLSTCIQIEQAWFKFFEQFDIPFIPLAYEDFAENYESTLEYLLSKLGVPAKDFEIPPAPLKKLSNEINEDFRSRFLAYMEGSADPLASLPGRI
jgi:LPS sulfotransferase NodH